PFGLRHHAGLSQYASITSANVDTRRIKLYTRVSASRMARNQDLYLISVAARMLGMHPQTLRKYERLGLVRPPRTLGSMRVYTREELERLRLIKHLVDEMGINLAGVQRLLSVADVVQRMRPLVVDDGLSRADARQRLARELEVPTRLLGL